VIYIASDEKMKKARQVIPAGRIHYLKVSLQVDLKYRSIKYLYPSDMPMLIPYLPYLKVDMFDDPYLKVDMFDDPYLEVDMFDDPYLKVNMFEDPYLKVNMFEETATMITPLLEEVVEREPV
jgi:predicted RNA-binding protein